MTLSLENNPSQWFPNDDLFKSETNWRVAYVKSRREKALAHFLANENIGYYLPMYLKKQAASKRARFSLMPVFSGYLFFRADDRERYRAVCSNHIVRTIDVHNSTTFLKEIEQIRIMLSSGQSVYPVASFKEGQRVRVKKGPLMDLEGIIVRRKSSLRLILSITNIMQSVAVEIDEGQLELLH